MCQRRFFPIAAALLLAGCAQLPTGPSVMVLPGSGKDFEQFKFDDAVCQQWAMQQTGTTTSKVSNDTAVSGAAVGTLVGAGAGAAIGAAAGDPAAGAAIGAGAGLLAGTAAGNDRAAGAAWSVQRRFDHAYMQCMYAKGNQIPVPAGMQHPPPPPARANPPALAPPPPRASSPPPPPPGNPPPPPPGV